MTAEQIAVLAEEGCRIVITHGNGPQVGSQLLRSEAGSSQTYTLPLDVCVAMTQGEIGYIIQTSLQSIFRSRNISIPVVSLITQVLVDKHDPAFQNPTKPIGPFYSKEIAQKKQDELNWNIIEDAARGYRRVVPSPKPLEVIEQDIIKDCLERGIIVIASGGGGIPITFENGSMTGVEAVIDKDRASALLATELNIERFIISTEVEKVYLNFKKSDQMAIDKISLDEAKKYLDEGHFLEGSMKPKIEAAIEFLESGGKEVVITNPEHLADAIKGKTGTHIIGRTQQ